MKQINGLNILQKLISLMSPLLPNATSLIRPDFTCSDIKILLYCPHKRGHLSYKATFSL